VRLLEAFWYCASSSYRRQVRRAAAFRILFNAGMHLMLSDKCDWYDLAAAQLIKEKMRTFA